MARVFKVWPKRVMRTNGIVLTPEMEVTVTMRNSTSMPFSDGGKVVQEAFLRLYNIDYKKAQVSFGAFDWKALD